MAAIKLSDERDTEASSPNHPDIHPTLRPTANNDVEKQLSPEPAAQNVSMFRSLGWLDRLLALWIFLAMLVGILLGNFVPSTGPALQKGKFVGVSIPIGEWCTFLDVENIRADIGGSRCSQR